MSDDLPPTLRGGSLVESQDVRLRLRLYDQRSTRVTHACTVPLLHSVKLTGWRIETGTSLLVEECLFISNGLGYEQRLDGDIRVYVHGRFGLKHVNLFDADLICVRDGRLVLPIDAPDRGYILVNSQVGVSFDFVGKDDNRLHHSSEL